MRAFVDLPREKPSSVLMLLGWNSFKVEVTFQQCVISVLILTVVKKNFFTKSFPV
jgi:hypothetical protein